MHHKDSMFVGSNDMRRGTIDDNNIHYISHKNTLQILCLFVFPNQVVGKHEMNNGKRTFESQSIILHEGNQAVVLVVKRRDVDVMCVEDGIQSCGCLGRCPCCPVHHCYGMALASYIIRT